MQKVGSSLKVYWCSSELVAIDPRTVVLVEKRVEEVAPSVKDSCQNSSLEFACPRDAVYCTGSCSGNRSG